VNPFVGTDAHGHAFPGAAVPFGMVQLSPDTRVEGWDACGGYHYSDSTILGFSHTHLSGTGVPDYGDILVRPGYRSGSGPAVPRALRFSHAAEKASPGSYTVSLDGGAIVAELTATERTGVHRYTFARADTPSVLVDLVHGLGPDRVIESYLTRVSATELAGYRRSAGWAQDQRVYFVARFSEPMLRLELSDAGGVVPAGDSLGGPVVRGTALFPPASGRPLVLKVGLSFADVRGARRNLELESMHKDFDVIRRAAESRWDSTLGRIRVQGGSEAERRTFTTALYHCMLAPTIASDVDGRYRGMDGSTRTATGFTMYSVFSLWDTFRALHPLLAILETKRTADFVTSLVAKYDESGTLPVWELASNETWTMIGYHAVPVLYDAYAKGIRPVPAARLLKAMTASARADRFGLAEYRRHGYIPAEREGESVSKTLEYAYDDWCVAEMAREAGDRKVHAEFAERSQYWKNVFDLATGFMRGRENGMWVEPFDPRSVTVHYTEGNAWHYAFFVPHDVAGLITSHGGQRPFLAKLDAMFSGSSLMTGRKQADITGLIGQYAHGNEPGHHAAYLYALAGAPWKTQRVVRRIMDSLYSDRPDGLAGNDDCGQLSAWYVLSALGFYPVTPGLPEYVAGVPLFDRARIRTDRGTTVLVEKSGTGTYVSRWEGSGVAAGRGTIAHDLFLNGGAVRAEMTRTPDTTLTRVASIPSRYTPIASTPFAFRESGPGISPVRVRLESSTAGAAIRYTADASEPSVHGTPARGTLEFPGGAGLLAVAEAKGHLRSRTMSAEFRVFTPPGRLVLNSRYDPQYAGGGDEALVDGRKGAADFRLGAWQGYHGVELSATLDLGTVKSVETVSLGCLQDNNSWIFFPDTVSFSFSEEGEEYTWTILVRPPVGPEDPQLRRHEFECVPGGFRARSIRVRAVGLGRCPAWHKGAGEPAWLFADELTVNAN
jgi:predicted alpha-1,2-mannosidase